MFGFFKKAAKQEALKLWYQNNGASVSLQEFDPALCQLVAAILADVNNRWTPGSPMPPDLLESMFRANKSLRVAYDQTPMRHASSFDQQFTPILGWKKYYEDF